MVMDALSIQLARCTMNLRTTHNESIVRAKQIIDKLMSNPAREARCLYSVAKQVQLYKPKTFVYACKVYKIEHVKEGLGVVRFFCVEVE